MPVSLAVSKIFPTWKFFVIYLVIPLLYANTSPITENAGIPPEPATSFDDIEKAVQKEMSPFGKFINMIPDTLDRGEFKGKLEMLARRACEVKQLYEEIGEIKTQKKDADKYKIFLALTHRVDELEKSFHPAEILTGDRYSRWKKIFDLNTPMVKELRKKVSAAGITQEQFCKKVQTLCNERNDRACHAAVELPEIIDKDSIRGALQPMKIPADKTTQEVLRILITPFEFGDLISTKDE